MKQKSHYPQQTHLRRQLPPDVAEHLFVGGYRNGVLTLITPNPNDGLTYTTGDGTEDPELTFTGTISDINEALAWLTYTPTMLAGDNGHGYGVIHTDALNWDQAKADAESRGGHLATITSAEEQQAIVSLGLPDGTFLGGYQDLNSPFYSEPDGGWKWVTGETWSYTNWDTDQPGNLSGTDHVLNWPGNAWHDYPVAATRTAYVIEYESVPDGIITLTTDDQGYSGTGGALSDSDTIALEFNTLPPFADSPTWTTIPAALDTTFDGDGKQVLSLSEGVDYIHEMLALDDGRILAVGAVDDRFAVLRFNSDLTLDSSFGDAGIQKIDFGAGRHALTLVLDKDGRILVGGHARLVRLTPDGTLDTSFGSGGAIISSFVNPIYDVEVQADGRIVTAGRDNDYFRINRYFDDGTKDTDLGDWSGNIWGGSSHDTPDSTRGVVLRDDGDILVTGTAGTAWSD